MSGRHGPCILRARIRDNGPHACASADGRLQLRCGRIKVTAELLGASYCHCRRCQRRSGAAASPSAHAAVESLRVISGDDVLRCFEDGGRGGHAVTAAHPSSRATTSIRSGSACNRTSSTAIRGSGRPSGRGWAPPRCGSRSRTTASHAMSEAATGSARTSARFLVRCRERTSPSGGGRRGRACLEDDRCDHDRPADQRRRGRALVHRQPDPERAEHDLEQGDEPDLCGRDQSGARR